MDSLVQKRLQIFRLVAFEIASGVVWAIGQITFAYFIPTVWALIFGLIFGSVVAMIGSYFLLPDIKHKFKIVRVYVWQIVHFGKWIFLSSTVYFLSMSFDRLYLAAAIPLALLGVYGIARAISDLLSCWSCG